MLDLLRSKPAQSRFRPLLASVCPSFPVMRHRRPCSQNCGCIKFGASPCKMRRRCKRHNQGLVSSEHHHEIGAVVLHFSEESPLSLSGWWGGQLLGYHCSSVCPFLPQLVQPQVNLSLGHYCHASRPPGKMHHPHHPHQQLNPSTHRLHPRTSLARSHSQVMLDLDRGKRRNHAPEKKHINPLLHSFSRRNNSKNCSHCFTVSIVTDIPGYPLQDSLKPRCNHPWLPAQLPAEI